MIVVTPDVEKMKGQGYRKIAFEDAQKYEGRYYDEIKSFCQTLGQWDVVNIGLSDEGKLDGPGYGCSVGLHSKLLPKTVMIKGKDILNSYFIFYKLLLIKG